VERKKRTILVQKKKGGSPQMKAAVQRVVAGFIIKRGFRGGGGRLGRLLRRGKERRRVQSRRRCHWKGLSAHVEKTASVSTGRSGVSRPEKTGTQAQKKRGGGI